MNCEFCGKEITNMSGRQTDSYLRHHINGDHYDTRPENEQDSHFGCHTRHHVLTMPKKKKEESREMWRKIGLNNKGKKGRKCSDETIERMRKSHLGKVFSKETCDRMKVSQRRRRAREKAIKLV